MCYSATNGKELLWNVTLLSGVVGLLIWILITSKKHINQNHKQVISHYYLRLLCIVIISALLFPLLLPFFLTLWAYRKHVDNRLRKKFGQSYGGLLKGTDSVWALEKNSKSIINVLLIIEYKNKQIPLQTALTSFLKNKIQVRKEGSSKLLSSLERNEPYHYLLKDQITVDDCVKSIDIEEAHPSETLSRNSLRNYISKIANQDLPKGHKALWEVNIGNKQIAYWNDKDRDYYPVIFRFHHSLLDGSTFLKFFVSFLGQDKIVYKDINQNISDEGIPLPKILKSKDAIEIGTLMLLQLREILKSMTQFLRHFIWFLPHMAILSCRKDDSNILNTENSVTDRAELGWFSEDVSKYIDIAKKTKNKVKGTTFSDVIFTAICKSLENYFIKNSQSIPGHLTSGIPIIPPIPELSHITPGKYEVDKVIFENNFSLVVQNLPTPCMTKPKTGEALVDKLLQMNENSTNLKNSVEPRANFWIMSFLGKYVPCRILSRGLDWVLRSTTVAISNLQGPKTIKFSEEMLVKDIVFWVPCQLNTGVGFSIVTYENRLQMGLIIDKSLLKSPNDLDSILKDTVTSIELLFNKVESL